ncbi:MAG: glycogen/starch synthase [bacterium]|nr:glycogen/starch synthase [Bacteroidales bacterium]MDO4209781.1 glycogen/starch synthase [bacterium]MDY3674636.1 glycogen/starch synthase [Prevotella sp.]MDD5813470.1 glycogen/starch synthase [Bacteroidales bacterium]MDD7659818.1 glycogen/starch synthase [Bacteroidales bacterium]
MQVKKVLFINTETLPYVPETDLSRMGKIVPEKVQSSGCEIRTFMPKWGIINERRGQLHEVIRLSGMNIIINGTDHPLIIKVASIPVSRVQVYFIDNDDYFTRRAIERDAEGQLFDDNAERAVFYARGVLETVKKLRWTPDVIHCQGWMAGIIPLYIRQAYNDEPCFSDAKIVTSLYSRNMDGIMGENVKDCIAYKDINRETLAAYDDAFTMADMERLAVDYSDGIIEMTEGYNPEIIQYAKEKGKAVLAYPGESFVEKYREFYESL